MPANVTERPGLIVCPIATRWAGSDSWGREMTTGGVSASVSGLRRGRTAGTLVHWGSIGLARSFFQAGDV